MRVRGGRSAVVFGIIAGIGEWFRDLFAPTGSSPLSFGKRSERIAERHLRWRGYRILARNFRAAGAEIDLIAIDGDTLVFVEVKARRSMVAGRPEEAVDARKQRRIRRAAEIFAERHRASDRLMRFDVVAITGEGRGRKLEILRDAF